MSGASLPLWTSLLATLLVGLPIAVVAGLTRSLTSAVLLMFYVPPSLGATLAATWIVSRLARPLPGAGVGPIALGLLSWHLAFFGSLGLMKELGLEKGFPCLAFASLIGAGPICFALALLTDRWETRPVRGILLSALGVGALSLLPIDQYLLIVGSTLIWTALVGWFVGAWIGDAGEFR